MRTLIIVAATLFAPLAQADECRNHYDAATGIMEHRQEGIVPIVDMMEIAAGFGEQMKTLHGLRTAALPDSTSRTPLWNSPTRCICAASVRPHQTRSI